VSVSQTLTRRRDADLLQRALEGDAAVLRSAMLTDPSSEFTQLVRLTQQLPRPQVAPDADFVARLRDQLVAEAARRPLPSAVDERTSEVSRTSGPGASRTVTVPRTLTLPRGRRLLAGLATMAVLAAALVGGLSTRSLPGDTLYPVKLMIGDAQVRLAGSDLGRGKALLGQVDTRLDEVDSLVAAGDPPSSLVDEALTRAGDDLGDAQRQLLTSGSGAPDPRALQALADAGAQATGRLAGLRERVPVASVPAVDRLLSQLAQGRSAMLQQLDRLVASGSCGRLCGTVRTTLEQQGVQLSRLLGVVGSGGSAAGSLRGALPGSSTVPGTGSGVTDGSSTGDARGTAPTSAPAAGGTGSGSRPSAPEVSLPGATVPGVTVPGASVGGGDGGLTASVPGATVSVPGASVSLPSVGVTVPTTSSTGLPLPGVTLGGTTPTLGPVTVPVPTIGVGGDCASLLCIGG
jgi:hypothetical protein